MDKAPDAFRTISEVADDLDVPQHVLRFWETRFAQIKPLKRGGGRRYYRPDDVDLLRGIRFLLYGRGFTIKGVQRILKDEGLRFVQGAWKDLPGAVNGAATPALRAPVFEAYRSDGECEEDRLDDAAFGPAPEGNDEPACPAHHQEPGLIDEQVSAIRAELRECRRVLAAVRMPPVAGERG